jgi:hypothetical protein
MKVVGGLLEAQTTLAVAAPKKISDAIAQADSLECFSQAQNFLQGMNYWG